MTIRDVGRYHKLPWGGGQITLPKELAKIIGYTNKDKLMIVYHKDTQTMEITKL